MFRRVKCRDCARCNIDQLWCSLRYLTTDGYHLSPEDLENEKICDFYIDKEDSDEDINHCPR